MTTFQHGESSQLQLKQTWFQWFKFSFPSVPFYSFKVFLCFFSLCLLTMIKKMDSASFRRLGQGHKFSVQQGGQSDGALNNSLCKVQCFEPPHPLTHTHTHKMEVNRRNKCLISRQVTKRNKALLFSFLSCCWHVRSRQIGHESTEKAKSNGGMQNGFQALLKTCSFLKVYIYRQIDRSIQIDINFFSFFFFEGTTTICLRTMTEHLQFYNSKK